MDRLWTPWRLDYIQVSEEEKGCVLCRILEAGDDRKALILHRGKLSYIVLNRFPYNTGHLMIVTNEHKVDIGKMSAETHHEILRLMGRSMEILQEILRTDGFNCGLNLGTHTGASIRSHFHMHVVPRWKGDTNFLPVIADTKTVPEYLEKTYDRLMGGFEKI